MAETTISWTAKVLPGGTKLPGYTFNPWIGCQKVAPACDGCYAEYLMDARFGRVQWGPHGVRLRTSQANWRKPYSWHNAAVRFGVRPFVFCLSLGDIFDNKAPYNARRDLFKVMRECHQLDWLLLTKRPQNIISMCRDEGGLPPNAALGTTVEDQTRAEMNIPELLKAKQELKPLFAFLSCEPLLGPIDLSFVDRERERRMDVAYHAGAGDWPGCGQAMYASTYMIDWVITGGETDQGDHLARPSHPAWFRSLRDYAKRNRIPYHHKQNGEWVSVSEVEGDGEHFHFPDGATVRKIGKDKSGRSLDGKIWHEHPGMPLGMAA